MTKKKSTGDSSEGSAPSSPGLESGSLSSPTSPAGDIPIQTVAEAARDQLAEILEELEKESGSSMYFVQIVPTQTRMLIDAVKEITGDISKRLTKLEKKVKKLKRK